MLETAGVPHTSGFLFEGFAHVKLPELKTPFGVICPRANRRNNRQTLIVAFPGNAFSLKQQLAAQTNVLGCASLFRPHFE